MNKNSVKGPSPIPKTQNQISHFQQKSTSHNSKPSKGSCRSNTSSQEKKDLSPTILDSKLSIKRRQEAKGNCSEGKQAIKIDLSQSSGSNQIDFSKLNRKSYIKIINRLFKYLKKILSHEIYTEIKRQFCEEAYRYINKLSYCLCRNNESQSSIFNNLKYDEILIKGGGGGDKDKFLKLSSDFSNLSGENNPVVINGENAQVEVPISLTSNMTNKNNNNDATPSIKGEKKKAIMIDDHNQNQTPTNNRLVVSYENPPNKSSTNHKQVKQSLYHLTKGRVNTPTIMKNDKASTATSATSNVNCFNKSKTQSNSKSSSRDCSHNSNNMLSKGKQVLIEINSTNKDNKHLLNSYSKEVSNINISKNATNISPKKTKNEKDNKAQPLWNGKLISKIDNKTIKEIIHNKDKSIETIDLLTNRQLLNQLKPPKAKEMIKSTEIMKKGNKLKVNHTSSFKSINKSSGPIIINSKTEKEKEVKTQYIDLARNEEVHSVPKNDEMIKAIKMSLDDNLKYMFNFSYENFLSKESESQSKQSQDLNEPSS